MLRTRMRTEVEEGAVSVALAIGKLAWRHNLVSDRRDCLQLAAV